MAGTGGTVTVIWGRGGSAAVTITGAGSFTEVGVGAATFPVSVDQGVTKFNTVTNGDYTVSATYQGRTIFSKVINLRGDNGVVYSLDLDLSELFNTLEDKTSVTTALEDIGAAINTTGKYAGKVVFNTTTGVLLVADGPDADDTWSTAAGVATHTPV